MIHLYKSDLSCYKLIAGFFFLSFILSSCSPKPYYSVIARNRSQTNIEIVKISWGDMNKMLLFGDISIGSGKEVGIVYYPKANILLTYREGKREVNKEIDITNIIPKKQSGRIIIYIRENDVIDIEFEKDK